MDQDRGIKDEAYVSIAFQLKEGKYSKGRDLAKQDYFLGDGNQILDKRAKEAIIDATNYFCEHNILANTAREEASKIVTVKDARNFNDTFHPIVRNYVSSKRKISS